MKSIVKHPNKYIYIIFSLLLVILLIFINVFISKKRNYYSTNYNGIDDQTAQILANSNETDLKTILNENNVFGLIELENGDELIQNFWINTLSIDQLYLTFDVEGNGATLESKIIDEAGNDIFQQNVILNENTTRVDLDVNSKEYSKYSKYTLVLKVNSNPNTKVKIYDCTYHDGSLTINGDANENVLLTGVNGKNYQYRSKIIFGLAALCIIIVIAMLLFNYSKQGVIRNIDRVINNVNKIWIFVWEWLSFLALLYVFLRLFTGWYYDVNLNILLIGCFIILFAVFMFLMIVLFFKMKNNIANIFVLLAIPIGICFVFLILPGNLPDEPVHFAKAYLTSQFDFSYTTDLNITTQYYTNKIINYNDILPAIFTADNYQSLTLCSEACAYHFILYIFSAIPLLLTRLLGLSIYLGFYCGRMVNLLIFIIAGYHSIKMAPFGKWIFFVYLFNPMLLQQAMSFSADSLINTTCLFAVAYFLNLKYVSEKIKNNDIVVVFSMIGIIFLSKYAYLPIFGIYLLLFDKLFKMTIKQWGLCVICIIAILAAYYGTVLLQTSMQTLASLDTYVKENNINQSEQINFLISNPQNIIDMFLETFKNKKFFYFNSFIGMLGVIAIPLNVTSYFGYYGLLLATPLIFDKNENKSFKISHRIWFAFIGMCVICLIILGLYLQWTPVATLVTEGVQGRYFIPAVILILFAILANKKKIIKTTNIIIPVYIVVVEALVFVDIINYFM